MGDPSGATIWIGRALNCPQDEIVQFHHHFTSPGRIVRSCNNGATVAQSLSVQDNLYVSQLNITVTHDIPGKTITCAYDNMIGTGSTCPFSTQIPGIAGPLCTYPANN